MTIDEALLILEVALGQQHLTRIQELVFRYAWEGYSYAEIANNCDYDIGYLKNIGSQMWRTLSQRFGEKVTKNNIQSVFKRQLYTVADTVLSSPIRETLHNPIPCYQDWGEATDTFLFYGRTTELKTLEQWIIDENCRIVNLFGMGGVGKTALAVKLGQQIAPQFQYLICRSLNPHLPLTQLLLNLLEFLDTDPPEDALETIDSLLSRLIQCLQKQRCLLILDGVDSILDNGNRGKHVSAADCPTETFCPKRMSVYQSNYSEYSEFLNLIGRTNHQSCLMLVSRKKLTEVDWLPIRSLQLHGLVVPDTSFKAQLALANSLY